MLTKININHLKQEKGNAAVIVLVIVAIAAIGGLAFFSMKMGDQSNKVTMPGGTEAQMAQNETAAGDEAKPLDITPGNPTVAVVDGKDIKRSDVFAMIQNLPVQTRQMPLDQLFPVALAQVVNARIIDEKTSGVKLDNDPEVKKQLAQAKEQIVKTVYLQNMVNDRLTDELVKKKYDEIIAATPEEEEVKASHILVDDEKTAEKVIKELQESGDFSALAMEYSKDATKDNGGDLGYFTRGAVVKEFADAAFGMEPGTYTSTPVKTQFGYHIIRVEDKRMRKPPTLEEAKPFIEANLRREILDKIVEEWKDSANIKTYGINGDPNAVEPSASDESAE